MFRDIYGLANATLSNQSVELSWCDLYFSQDQMKGSIEHMRVVLDP